MSNPHFFQLGAVSGMAHKLFSTRLNRYVGLGDMVVGPYPESHPYLAVTRPGYYEVWILDFNALDPVTYPDEYINLSSHPELVVQTIDLADYSAEGPTDLCIVSESEGYYSYVAATQTSGEKKLLRFEIDQSGTWNFDRDIPIYDNNTIGQYADMEVRTDQGYLYIALPQSNGVFPFRINTLTFDDESIQVDNPTDLEPTKLTLMPYYEDGQGQANRIIDLLTQIPADVFTPTDAKNTLLADATQLISELTQDDVLDTVREAMDLRAFVSDCVTEPVYQQFLVKAVDSVLMQLVKAYLDPGDPGTYTEMLSTIVQKLPHDAFFSPGLKGQLIANISQLRSSLTTQQFVDCDVKETVLKQSVNNDLSDQDIIIVLNDVLDRVNALIAEIYTQFAEAIYLNNTIQSVISSLADEDFNGPQGRENVSQKSEQLGQVLQSHDHSLSLVRLNVLNISINTHLTNADARAILFLKTGKIQEQLDGMNQGS